MLQIREEMYFVSVYSWLCLGVSCCSRLLTCLLAKLNPTQEWHSGKNWPGSERVNSVRCNVLWILDIKWFFIDRIAWD